jgi:hypothetical protein
VIAEATRFVPGEAIPSASDHRSSAIVGLSALYRWSSVESGASGTD